MATRQIPRELSGSHHTITDEVDENRILIRPGNLARAAKTVDPSKAVESLREVHRQEQEHAKATAEAQARLDAARAKAVEIQEGFEARQNKVAELKRGIARGDNGAAQYREQLQALEAEWRNKLSAPSDWGFTEYCSQCTEKRETLRHWVEEKARLQTLLTAAEADLKQYSAAHL